MRIYKIKMKEKNMGEEYRQQASELSAYYFAIYGKNPEKLSKILTEEFKQNIRDNFSKGINEISQAAQKVIKLKNAGMNITDYYEQDDLENLIKDLYSWHVKTTDALAKEIEAEIAR